MNQPFNWEKTTVPSHRIASHAISDDYDGGVSFLETNCRIIQSNFIALKRLREFESMNADGVNLMAEGKITYLIGKKPQFCPISLHPMQYPMITMAMLAF